MINITTVSAAGVTTTSLLISVGFAEVDAAVLIGATSGASLFVIQANDLPRWIRLIYFFISAMLGYLVGPSFMSQWISEPALASFVFASCCIGVGTKLISVADQLNILNFFKSR